MPKIFIIPLVISATAFIAFVIGLFDPDRAIFWSKKKTRIQLVAYLVVGVVFGAIWFLIR